MYMYVYRMSASYNTDSFVTLYVFVIIDPFLVVILVFLVYFLNKLVVPSVFEYVCYAGGK